MILATLSGGIDSVAMCYLLLKQGEKLHIHHVEIDNEENRTHAENVAVKKVLNYFNSVGLTNYQYTSSKISCPTFNGHFLFDSDAYNLFAGFICSTDKKITQVAVGTNKEDLHLTASDRVKRSNSLLQLFANVEKIYPIKDYSKKDLYELLPQELKDSFWSCRTPVYKDNYAKPCDRCQTCYKMKKFGITQPSLNLINTL